MSGKQLILAHDLGTTGNKATLFDNDGNHIGSAFAGYETNYPQLNWAEQNPTAWWQAVTETTQQLLTESHADPSTIAAVGFSGQMMGCVPVNSQGEALRSCIIWADQRAQAQAETMAQHCGDDLIYDNTGHRPSAAYSASKILWLRDEQPTIYEQTACFLQPKDYIIQQLTDQFVTDYSDASGTTLFDLVQRRWHPAILEGIGLSIEQLPTLHPANTIVGEVTTRAAEATGLAAGTPVVVGGGDGSCATVGAGVIEPGGAYCNIGSSAWISMSSAQPILDPQRRTFTFHHLHPDYYCPTGTMQTAGGARDWVWRLFADQNNELDAAAAQIAPGSTGLLFLPYLMGERSPHWNPLARGTFVGLSMSHGKAEMARATLEGVAFNLRLILDTIRAQVPNIEAMRLIGGGSRGTLWQQILADCFNLPIHVLALQGDATSWGAAVAAGVAVGLYDWPIAAQRTEVIKVVDPNPTHVALYNELSGVFQDSYDALEPIFERLAGL